MTRLSPVPRRELIQRLQRLGFEGPYAGGNHEFMLRTASAQRLTLPNPHRGSIGVDLLIRLLRQANVASEDWDRSGG